MRNSLQRLDKDFSFYIPLENLAIANINDTTLQSIIYKEDSFIKEDKQEQNESESQNK